MNNMMEYRGYHAKIEFSAEDECFIGRVFGVSDVLAFDGENVEELQAAFHTCIDEYLEMCQEIGKEPNKEFKGSFNIRIPAELHKSAAMYAAEKSVSLNQVIAQSVEWFLSKEEPSLIHHSL